MAKQVAVLKEDGSELLPTFQKRAKQLVKTGRAKWVSDTAICLSEESQGEICMQQSNGIPRSGHDTGDGYTIAAEDIDEELYIMAKKQVEERLALITHIAVYIAVNLFLFAIQPDGGWQMYVIGGWGIGLVCHMINYYFMVTPAAVQKEYTKLKNKHRL